MRFSHDDKDDKFHLFSPLVELFMVSYEHKSLLKMLLFLETNQVQPFL